MVISIIIPVYNAEKYLKRCLDSVLMALENTRGEILLIDNGSTDKSLEVAQDYTDKNIHILSCNKRGAAAARNYGISKARGEYVWFIDADDYIAPDAIDKLLSKAREAQADLVMLGAKRIARDGSTSYLSAVDETKKDYKSRFVRYGMGPWQVLIHRKWWKEHGFCFTEGMIQEDIELMSALILYTDKLAHVDEPLYFYCDNPESVLHKSKFNPHIFDIFPALSNLYKRFEQAGAETLYHDELEWFFIWNLLIDAAKDFAKFPESKEGFQKSRQMLKQYFPDWRRNRFLKQKPLKLQILVRLNYYR